MPLTPGVMYAELLSNTRAAYQAYLDTATDVGRVQAVLDALSDEKPANAAPPTPAPPSPTDTRGVTQQPASPSAELPV